MWTKFCNSVATKKNLYNWSEELVHLSSSVIQNVWSISSVTLIRLTDRQMRAQRRCFATFLLRTRLRFLRTSRLIETRRCNQVSTFFGEKVFPTFWPTLSSDMLHDKRLAVLHIYCLIRSPFDILIMLPTPLCGVYPLNYISWISIRHLLVIKDGVLRRLLELHENGNVLETTLNQLYEGTCVSLIIQSID